MKTCTRCGESKILDAFHRCKTASDGRAPHCASCGAALSRLYYETHKAQVSERERDRRNGADGPDLRAHRRERNAARRDILSEQRRRYRTENAAHMDAKERARLMLRRESTEFVSRERARCAAAARRRSAAYEDGHVVNVINARFTYHGFERVRGKDVPRDLLETLRAQLKVKKLLKEIRRENT